MILSLIFLHQLHRECLLVVRKPLSLIQPWIFFSMIILLFPFVFYQSQITALMPGFIWIAALLAYLLSVERFFEVDYDNGTLDCLLIYPFSLSLSVLAKMVSHWLLTGLPITLLSLILGTLTGLSWHEAAILMWSLLIGTPTFSALGTLLGAITVTLSSRGLLLGLLLIPLSIPVLIFGVGSVSAITMHISAASSLAFLGAITLTALMSVPYAASTALRLN